MAEDTPGPVDPVPRWTAARAAHAIGWWAATLVVLVVIDDLTFGPFFWVMARLGGGWVAFTVALAIYIPVQVGVVWRGTSDAPGRVASFFLDRLELDRRSAMVQERETRLRDHVRGTVSSCLLAVVIGGVIPPMLLWRSGHPTSFVRRTSVLTATVYAVEFACLHGLLPALI